MPGRRRPLHRLPRPHRRRPKDKADEAGAYHREVQGGGCAGSRGGSVDTVGPQGGCATSRSTISTRSSWEGATTTKTSSSSALLATNGRVCKAMPSSDGGTGPCCPRSDESQNRLSPSGDSRMSHDGPPRASGSRSFGRRSTSLLRSGLAEGRWPRELPWPSCSCLFCRRPGSPTSPSCFSLSSGVEWPVGPYSSEQVVRESS